MTIQLLAFYVFAAVLVGTAVGVITVRNPVHAVLLLVLAFFTSSCLWLLVHAEFLAIALILVYVGAVMVLFLFVVMMLDIKVAPLREGFARYLPVGIFVAAVMLFEMLTLIGLRRYAGVVRVPDPATAAGLSNTEWLGRALFRDYLLPFEIAAVVLTVAIIAAVALTLRQRGNTRSQDPAKQVLVRKQDRLRVVQMPVAGKEPRA
jgi:NADH-quinone oxidoreductase subunit J